MGDEERGRSDLTFKRQLFDGILKEACRQAGYKILTIGFEKHTIKAAPAQHKLMAIAKKLRLTTHTNGVWPVKHNNELLYWDVVQIPNWENEELLEPRRHYDLTSND